MNDQDKTKEELIKEVELLRSRLADLETFANERPLLIEELKESEEKYKSLYENAPLSYQSLNEDGSFRDVNPAWLQTLGYKREEVIGKFYADFLHPDWKAHFETNFPAFKKRGYVHDVQSKIRHKDGHYLDISFEGCIGYMPDGSFKQTYCVFQDITERKVAEQALQESKDRIQAMFQTIPDMMFRLDRQGVFLDYKADIGELYTQSDSAIIGKCNRDITPIEFADLVDLKIRTILETGTLQTFEYQLPIPGQGIRFYEARMAVSGTDEVTSIVRDITERKLAEDKIKESEEKYRLIVENIGEGFGFVNVEEQFLLANKSAELIFGVEPGGLVGKNLDQFVSKDQFCKIQEETKIRTEGIQSVYEIDIIRPNGEKRTIHLTAVPQKHKNGSSFGTYGIFRDITERKLAEEALRASQQLIEGIINAIPVRIFWKDRNSIYLGCNKIFADDAGFSDPKDLIGKDDFQMGWHDQAELYRSGDRQIMESGIPILLNEEPQTTPEGNTIILLTNKIPLKNSKEEVCGILGTSMNVTERVAIEQEIKCKNEELRNLNAEKDKFFSIIAHDLRGPFNGFLGLTQVMSEELDTLSKEEILRMAKALEKSAFTLFSLLENLLNWSRMKQGLIPFNPIGLQLLTVVDESIAIVLDQAKIKGIDIAVDISADLSVFADNNMLPTIIRNLVSNALKFTHKGGKVTISASSGDDNKVVVAIKDTGIGMSSEMVENLFRLDVQNGRLGTDGESSSGLGLLLCKEFVEKHGCKICVKSEEGKGSTFWFTIPGNAQS